MKAHLRQLCRGLSGDGHHPCAEGQLTGLTQYQYQYGDHKIQIKITKRISLVNWHHAVQQEGRTIKELNILIPYLLKGGYELLRKMSARILANLVPQFSGSSEQA